MFRSRLTLLGAQLQSACQQSSSGCTRAASSSSGRDHIFGCAVVERLPGLSPSLPPELDAHREWQQEWRAGQYKQYTGDQFAETSSSEAQQQSLASSWSPVPVRSAADDAQDVTSLRRLLDRRLYLLVRGANDRAWHFPAATVSDAETIRQTAERALAESVGTSMNTWFVGNAPMGHLTGDGTSRFFMKAQVLDGEVAVTAAGGSHAWVTKEELPEYLKDTESQELMAAMLPDL